MNVLIFAGGQGTRLWPASRKSQPKQLLKLVGKDTLLQQTYKRMRKGFNTLTSENNIMLKLLEKGYDANTINELFERNSDLIYTDESLPVETKIEKAINEFANQDLLIKIRDSKKKIIKRLIITKK